MNRFYYLRRLLYLIFAKLNKEVHESGVDIIVLFAHFFFLKEAQSHNSIQILRGGLTRHLHIGYNMVYFGIGVIEQAVQQLMIVFTAKVGTSTPLNIKSIQASHSAALSVFLSLMACISR